MITLLLITGGIEELSKRNHNIDIIKALAIISVIILHSLSNDVLFIVGAPYHVWQTVPIFLLLTGYNSSKSFERRGYNSVKDYYNPSYLWQKFKRLLVPFLIVWAFQLLAQIVLVNNIELKDIPISLISGGWGPGSYYIPIIIQATLIVPLIYLALRKSMSLSLISLFVVSLFLEYVCVWIGLPASVYRILIIRYIFALALGSWLALKNSIKYKLLLLFSLISFIYITGINYYDIFIIYDYGWLSQHAPAYFWPLFLITIGLKSYKVTVNNAISRLFVKIGRASYHIFLTQMVYFWSIGKLVDELPILASLVINIMVCVTVGIFFYQVETMFWLFLNKRKQNDKIVEVTK